MLQSDSTWVAKPQGSPHDVSLFKHCTKESLQCNNKKKRQRISWLWRSLNRAVDIQFVALSNHVDGRVEHLTLKWFPSKRLNTTSGLVPLQFLSRKEKSSVSVPWAGLNSGSLIFYRSPIQTVKLEALIYAAAQNEICKQASSLWTFKLAHH